METNVPAGENVRKVSANRQNELIDRMILRNIEIYSSKSKEDISRRIKELDKEWDIERVLDLTMSLMAICGITASLIFNPFSIILPIILLIFFIWHAFQGWCPPIPILRYLKVRTRPEIDREKYALKAIRGDFKNLPDTDEPARRAFESVKEI